MLIESKNSFGGSGGSSLPVQTGHAGEFLTTDGSALSWSAVSTGSYILSNGDTTMTADATIGAGIHLFAITGDDGVDRTSRVDLSAQGMQLQYNIGSTFFSTFRIDDDNTFPYWRFSDGTNTARVFMKPYGLEYETDYSASFTSLSLVTKGNLDLKANIASPTFTGTVSGITSTMVGLGNVNNTSDAGKPVSTATQTALNLKLDIANPVYTGKLSLTATTANAAINTSTLWLQGMDIGTYFGDSSVAISIASGRTYLMNFYNAGAANIRMQLTSAGNFGLGDFAVGTGNHFEQRVLASNKVGYFLRGAAGQTADLMNWADNTPTVLAGINAEGGFYSVSSLSLNYVAKTSTYNIATNDYTIDCTSGTFTVTLPTAVGVVGKIYNIKNSGAGTITIATTSSQTIDGVTTKTISVQYTNIQVQSNGANWITL